MEKIGVEMSARIRVQTFHGIPFYVLKGSMHPEFSFFTFDGEEKEFREDYWQIKSGDVVFDIGASYGAYALAACSVGATCYAFEPEKSIAHDLANNVMINGWEGKCFVSDSGLWSSKKLVNMKDYAPHWPQATITGDYMMNTIDDIVEEQNIQKLDWIKIDVEGAEEHVIMGALKSIRRFHPKLIIECHVFLDAELKDKIKTILSDVGGYIFNEMARPPCIMLLAIPFKEK